MADEWTFGTVVQWIEAKLETIHAVLRERQAAVDIAFANFKGWMATTNEWRGAQEKLLETRVSQEAHDALAARVKRLEDAETKSGGKAAGYGQIGTIVATSIATAGAVLMVFAAYSGA